MLAQEAGSRFRNLARAGNKQLEPTLFMQYESCSNWNGKFRYIMNLKIGNRAVTDHHFLVLSV